MERSESGWNDPSVPMYVLQSVEAGFRGGWLQLAALVSSRSFEPRTWRESTESCQE